MSPALGRDAGGCVTRIICQPSLIVDAVDSIDLICPSSPDSPTRADDPYQPAELPGEVCVV